MNGTGVPPAPLTGGGLHARRCVRHPAREAAARCPSCGEFFCRECVVEHDGRLLCAACLARAVSAHERQRRRFIALRRAAGAIAGLVVLWLCFQSVGLVLLKIPPQVHDGTVWKPLVERAAP